MPWVGGVPSSLREGNTHTTEASCGPAPAGKVTGIWTEQEVQGNTEGPIPEAVTPDQLN